MTVDRVSIVRALPLVSISMFAIAVPASLRAAALSADVYVLKNADSPIHQNGDPMEWGIVFENNGPDDAVNVVFTDTIPAGTTFLSVGGDAGGLGCTTPAVGGTGTVRCLIPTLAPNTPINILIDTQIRTNMTGIQNTAHVSADTPDPDLSNNSSSDSTSVTSVILPNAPISRAVLVALGLAIASTGILFLRR